jgi:hypothetical protein
VVFPRGNEGPGDFLDVRIQRANSATLFGLRIGEPIRNISGEFRENAA